MWPNLYKTQANNDTTFKHSGQQRGFRVRQQTMSTHKWTCLPESITRCNNRMWRHSDFCQPFQPSLGDQLDCIGAVYVESCRCGHWYLHGRDECPDLHASFLFHSHSIWRHRNHLWGAPFMDTSNLQSKYCAAYIPHALPNSGTTGSLMLFAVFFVFFCFTEIILITTFSTAYTSGVLRTEFITNSQIQMLIRTMLKGVSFSPIWAGLLSSLIRTVFLSVRLLMFRI